LLIYRMHEYYISFLSASTQNVLFWIFIGYAVLALPFYLFYPFKTKHESKGTIAFRGVYRFIRTRKIEQKEKVTLLFILVKFFYIPLMINFVFGNSAGLDSRIMSFAFNQPIDQLIINSIYPLSLALLFFIDTLFFTFGYLVEADFLKNKVKSVEPTFFGWAVTLLTYPPFNNLYNQFFPWVANDYASFGFLTVYFRLAIIALVVVFVWATISLGPKASNLTNRGIVTHGAYKYVRHPAYASKNAVWWLTIIPIFGLHAIFIMAAWSFLYYLRAVTEERHLSADPDYIAYKKKVKYMFIPRVI